MANDTKALIVLIITALLLAVSLVFPAHASQRVISQGTADLILEACGTGGGETDDRQREFERVAKAEFFKAAAELASRTIVTYCSGVSRESLDLYESILAVADKLAEEGGAHNIDWLDDPANGDVDLQGFVDSIRADSIKDVQVPSIEFRTRTIDGPVRITNGDFRTSPENQADCNAQVELIAPNSNCNQYLEEFHTIYKTVQALYASQDAAVAAATLKKLDEDWTAFMNETIDQTPLELAFNGWLFRKKHKGYRGFVAPPEWQHILLKPYVAVDWAGEAPDGSNVQEALVLDVWGIKRRDVVRDKWYTPIGGSIHIVGSDRPEVEDFGIGLSVHFTKMHTIGLTSYDGDLGVFLSFDLWKNATDQYQTAGSRIKDYRTRFDELREGPLGELLSEIQE